MTPYHILWVTFHNPYNAALINQYHGNCMHALYQSNHQC